MAVNSFNAVWDILDAKERSREDVERMIHLSHTSYYHWTQVEEHTFKNLSIGYWQLSRVYATAMIGERALYFAERCLEVSLKGELEPFYLAYAYEAKARAYALDGDNPLTEENVKLAYDYIGKILDVNSKKMLGVDLETIRY
jgi:hypothetical protein